MKEKQKKRILVADDDPVIRLLINEILAGQDYELEVVSSGEACLKSLQDNTPDLLLLDVIMPEMNGIEVLEAIRKQYSSTQFPIIMLSTNTETEAPYNTNQLSPDCYLQKPFLAEKALETIQSFIEDEST